MSVIKGLSGSTYHSLDSQINVIISSLMSLSTYFTDLFFSEDSSRLVIASNAYALRRRTQTQRGTENSSFQVNSFNFPFMNLGLSSGGIELDNGRLPNTRRLTTSGIYDETLQKKVRLTPININFESTYFSQNEKDIQFVMDRLLWEQSAETILTPSLEIDGNSFSNYGSLRYSTIGYNTEYSEQDWLEKNKIRTVSIAGQLTTYLVRLNPDGVSNKEAFCIPKTLILSYSDKLGINLDSYEDTELAVIERIMENLVWE